MVCKNELGSESQLRIGKILTPYTPLKANRDNII